MTIAPSLAVVIATSDRYAVLEDTLRDLLVQSEPADEILVVDATPAADHAIPAWVDAPTHARVRYLRSEGIGANRARNVGLRDVRADYVLLLDDDMRLPTDCLARVRAAHREGWEAVHGQLTENGRSLVPMTPSDRPLWDVVRHRHGDLRCHTIAVSSGFTSIRTARLRALGWLDEDYVYLFDDLDLGLGLWRAGCITLHDPRVTATHLRAPAGGGRHPQPAALMARNKYADKYRFLAKWFSARALRVELMVDVAIVLRAHIGRPVALVRELKEIADAWRAHARVPWPSVGRPRSSALHTAQRPA